MRDIGVDKEIAPFLQDENLEATDDKEYVRFMAIWTSIWFIGAIIFMFF